MATRFFASMSDNEVLSALRILVEDARFKEVPLTIKSADDLRFISETLLRQSQPVPPLPLL